MGRGVTVASIIIGRGRRVLNTELTQLKVVQRRSVLVVAQ